MALTDTALRNLKPLEKQYKKTDGGGLYLLVKPNGGRLWRLDYRYFGTRKTLAIGSYPEVTLVQARKARDEARSLLAQDIDPGAHRKEVRAKTTEVLSNTFGKVADDFLESMRRKKRAAPTMQKNTWMLKELAGSLSNRPITQITAKEVMAVLKKIEDSGRIESSIATRATIGRVFRHGIAIGVAENDPTVALRGALLTHKAKSFAAITAPTEVGGLVRAVKSFSGWPTLRAALMVQMYAFARPGETRSMLWSELDLENRVWHIPLEKAKMRKEHDVPLSDQAIEVIESMRLYRNRFDTVFPSMMSGKPILSENSMNTALRRMGFASNQHTAHGFRSTASTLLNESKQFRGEVIEMQLAHQDPDTVRSIYNRALYWDERVPMMQWYADHLDKLAESR